MNEKVLWHIQSLWEESLCENAITNVPTQPWNQISRRFTHVETWNPYPSSQPVMSDEVGEYFGLSEDVLLFEHETGKPVYIFDNHHKALFAFLDTKENTGKVLPVVHIDAHPDDARSGYNGGIISTENIKQAYEQSRICDFLDTAGKGNLIRETMRVVTSAEFEKFTNPLPNPLPCLPAGRPRREGEQPFILSLDIDIFGPEGGYIELDQKIKTIARAWQQATVITIATSPGFIDQEYAWKIIEIMLRQSQDML